MTLSDVQVNLNAIFWPKCSLLSAVYKCHAGPCAYQVTVTFSGHSLTFEIQEKSFLYQKVYDKIA